MSALPPPPPLRIRQLAQLDYTTTWERMRAFTAARTSSTADELWVVEHPPVFTLGQAGRAAHVLAAGDIAVVPSDRGGQVTYHGPGQVVVYVLLDLRRLGIYVKELVFRIEQAVIQTLEGYGVSGRRVPSAPGVYVPVEAEVGHADVAVSAHPFAGLAKIAALGIKVTRGCSYHGVALNVAMDLSPYARIDPCGYAGLAVTDLATQGVAVTVQQAAELLTVRLSAHLSSHLSAHQSVAVPVLENSY